MCGAVQFGLRTLKKITVVGRPGRALGGELRGWGSPLGEPPALAQLARPAPAGPGGWVTVLKKVRVREVGGAGSEPGSDHRGRRAR